MTTELKQTSKNINNFGNQLKTCPDDVRNQLQTFVGDAKSEIKELNGGLDRITSLGKKLAEHFCENEQSFKIEECVATMTTFCEKVQQCEKENEQRRIQEEKAERRKKQQAEMMSHTKHSKKNIPDQDDGCIIDRLLNDIKKGYKLRKATTPLSSPSKRDKKSNTIPTSSSPTEDTSVKNSEVTPALNGDVKKSTLDGNVVCGDEKHGVVESQSKGISTPVTNGDHAAAAEKEDTLVKEEDITLDFDRVDEKIHIENKENLAETNC